MRRKLPFKSDYCKTCHMSCLQIKQSKADYYCNWCMFIFARCNALSCLHTSASSSLPRVVLRWQSWISREKTYCERLLLTCFSLWSWLVECLTLTKHLTYSPTVNEKIYGVLLVHCTLYVHIYVITWHI